ACHLPQAQVVAVDISPAALNLARENAARHGVEDKIEFVKMDLLRATPEDRFRRAFELIVSNPPYISRDEEELLPPEVRQFEPPEALFAEDPMAFYRALARLSRQWLVPGGWLLCELAPHRAGQVKNIFEKAGFTNLELFPDLAAKLRGIKARTPIKKEENRDQSKHLSRV
ncbi:MAG: peptide chain release factor N(5)-glutamine methyltransferase, partial [Calditrichaeota bacterium]